MKNRWTTNDIPDQSGKIIVITGANSGLGFSSTKALAAKGAKVVLAVRNLQKGQAAMDEVKQAVPEADLVLMKCDVSDLESVKQFVEAFRGAFTHADILMNNAGIMATPPMTSPQGFEAQFATNHLGHFALTGLMLGTLAQAPNGARVVNVSSLAARQGQMQFDDINWRNNYHPFKVYSQSKLANQLFTYALQKRLERSPYNNITAHVAHPGGSNTNLVDAIQLPKLLKRILIPVVMPMAMSADQGALPQLYAATAPQAEPGGYYGPHAINEVRGYPKPAKVPAQAKSLEAQNRLWEMSEEMTGVNYLS